VELIDDLSLWGEKILAGKVKIMLAYIEDIDYNL